MCCITTWVVVFTFHYRTKGMAIERYSVSFNKVIEETMATGIIARFFDGWGGEGVATFSNIC